MVKLRKEDKIFFTSDTHFWHTNIIKYCNRPFENVEEMNEKLIQNWNSIVPKDGLVFHLGDFAFSGPTKASVILEQLNGNIVLIRGNHDYRSTMKLFNQVYDQLLIQIEDDQIYLNHYPFLTFSGAYSKNTYQLFGHVHSNGTITDSPDCSRLQYLLSNQYDVGVDNNNFKPVTWLQIKEKLCN